MTVVIFLMIVIFAVSIIITRNKVSPREERARQLAERAKHLNGHQLLGFLSTYAQDEEEMQRALEILMKHKK